MTDERNRDQQPGTDPFLHGPEAMMALAQRSFALAVDQALDENDRLGLPSPEGHDGEVVVREPAQAGKAVAPA